MPPDWCAVCGKPIQCDAESGAHAVLLLPTGDRIRCVPVDSSLEPTPEFTVCRECLVAAMSAPTFQPEPLPENPPCFGKTWDGLTCAVCRECDLGEDCFREFATVGLPRARAQLRNPADLDYLADELGPSTEAIQKALEWAADPKNNPGRSQEGAPE
jgi:hypothetical protein